MFEEKIECFFFSKEVYGGKKIMILLKGEFFKEDYMSLYVCFFV